MLEHDHEPEPGLPETLPADEKVLWRGKPDARSLASGTFQVGKLAIYFAIVLVLRLIFQLIDGESFAEALPGIAMLALVAAAALALLTAYASRLAKSALFTITNRRVVLRFGVAVPLTVNLPFPSIEAVNVRERKDGSGEIAILPEAGSRVSYILLWPMVKPFRVMRVQPILRGLPGIREVSTLLAEALAVDARLVGSNAATDADPTEGSKIEHADSAGDIPQKSWRDWLTYPTLPLAAASSLVVIALVAVGWTSLTDAGSRSTDVVLNEAVVASVDLFFEDRSDGAVAVIDAADGSVIDLLEPGTSGFVRGTLRSFARARRAIDAGKETPFSVQRTETGRILLSDSLTGRFIDLRAFGATNAEAFGRYLFAGENASTRDASSATVDPAGDLTSVASAGRGPGQ